MGFVTRWPLTGAVGLHAAARVSDRFERAGQCAQAVRQPQQATGEDGLERADGIGAIGPVRGLIAQLGRRHAGEDRVQIVGQNFGGEVLLEGQMGQSGGGFQAQSMLEAFEQLGDILPVNVSPVKS